MARDWSDVKKYGKYAWGATLPGGIYNTIQALRGKGGYSPLLDTIAPVQPDIPQLNTRPSLGLEGQQAAQEQARAMQSILNQNLMSTTIPMINRQYSGAGRYASGQRLGAIGKATQQSQALLGQNIGANALQVYLAQLSAQEERDWRQAQLDLAGTQQDSAAGGWGELLPYLIYAGMI